MLFNINLQLSTSLTELYSHPRYLSLSFLNKNFYKEIATNLDTCTDDTNRISACTIQQS